MAESEISKVEFPGDIEASIRQVMVETGLSKDEIVLQLMRYFFELVNDTGNEDVPALVKKVRAARAQKPVDDRLTGN